MVWFQNKLINLNQNHIYEIPYQCDTSQECQPIRSKFPRGEFKIELWGGQGGSSDETDGGNGGRGGYTPANVTFSRETTVFINIGAHGICPSKEKPQTGPTFNGGGDSTFRDDDPDFLNAPYLGCSGGGATDIRINSNSLSSRILVAGGGGGAGKDTRETSKGLFQGGYGGGENGGNGALGLHHLATPGYGASQTGSGTKSNPGGFGYGGSSGGSSGGGGGGGYYGGAASSAGCSGGGGGSGFIAKSTGVATIKTNAFLKGMDLIPAFQQKTRTLGNIGHGAIRITVIWQHIEPFTCKFNRRHISILNSIAFLFLISND